MKRLLFIVFLAVLFIEIYSVRPHSPEEMDPTDEATKHFLSGVLHIHTQASDGGENLPEIVEAAKKAGRHFLVITDINSSVARKEEGRYGGVDAFVEMEVIAPQGNLLSFYSTSKAASEPDGKIPRMALQHLSGKEPVEGMFNIVAHPSHPKRPWNDLVRNPEGIEVFNFDSLWRKQLDDSMLKFGITGLIYPFSNFLAALRIQQTSRKDLTTWDAMNAIQPGRFGVIASHSHANFRVTPSWGLHWPSHEQTFKLASNIVFYDPPLYHDFSERKKQIYSLMQQGKSAMVFDMIYPFQGNDWTVECDQGKFRSGDRLTLAGQCEFVARLPKDLGYHATLRLWRAGDLVKEIENAGSVTHIPVTRPGIYRLEVWLKIGTLFKVLLSGESPYVFYNPIYID